MHSSRALLFVLALGSSFGAQGYQQAYAVVIYSPLRLLYGYDRRVVFRRRRQEARRRQTAPV